MGGEKKTRTLLGRGKRPWGGEEGGETRSGGRPKAAPSLKETKNGPEGGPMLINDGRRIPEYKILAVNVGKT